METWVSNRTEAVLQTLAVANNFSDRVTLPYGCYSYYFLAVNVVGAALMGGADNS